MSTPFDLWLQIHAWQHYILQISCSATSEDRSSISTHHWMVRDRNVLVESQAQGPRVRWYIQKVVAAIPDNTVVQAEAWIWVASHLHSISGSATLADCEATTLCSYTFFRSAWCSNGTIRWQKWHRCTHTKRNNV